MRTRWLAVRFCGPLASTMALSSSVHAAGEEPRSADIASARALGQEGVKLADAGNCQEAIERLTRAEKIYHAPTTLGRLGECQVQVGKVVDGTENLNKVVRETLAPHAPAAFVKAQERAKKALAEGKLKIAKLKISVAGPADLKWVVTIDGDSIPLANLNTNRPVDPGEHVVEATASGYNVARVKVTLTDGGTDSVVLTPELIPKTPDVPLSPVTAVPPTPQPVPPAPPAPSAARYPMARPAASGTSVRSSNLESSPSPSHRIPAYVTLGVGVTGVALGSVFGLLATSKKSDLDSACRDHTCTPDRQHDIDTGKTFATVSTVGFVVGAVGLAAGAYLYLRSGRSHGTASLHPTSAKSDVVPFVDVPRGGIVF